MDPYHDPYDHRRRPQDSFYYKYYEDRTYVHASPRHHSLRRHSPRHHSPRRHDTYTSSNRKTYSYPKRREYSKYSNHIPQEPQFETSRDPSRDVPFRPRSPGGPYPNPFASTNPFAPTNHSGSHFPPGGAQSPPRGVYSNPFASTDHSGRPFPPGGAQSSPGYGKRFLATRFYDQSC